MLQAREEWTRTWKVRVTLVAAEARAARNQPVLLASQDAARWDRIRMRRPTRSHQERNHPREQSRPVGLFRHYSSATQARSRHVVTTARPAERCRPHASAALPA